VGEEEKGEGGVINVKEGGCIIWSLVINVLGIVVEVWFWTWK